MTKLNNANNNMNGFLEIFKYGGLKNIRTVVEQVDAGRIADQLRSVNKALGQNNGGRDRAELKRERELCERKLRAVVEVCGQGRRGGAGVPGRLPGGALPCG